MRAVLLVTLIFWTSLAAWCQTESDVVVYGGTAGGVIAAVTAAREALSVVLLEPGRHLGGMATGGLSRTDFGKKPVIGGYALEFYWRVGQHYDLAQYAQSFGWYYEPHVGEQVLQEMLREVNVRVYFGQRLRESNAVEKRSGKVVSLTAGNGQRYTGKVFIDCSYEGDLMAQAGIRFAVGRESSAQYGESLAGVRDRTPFHQFTLAVDAFDSNHRLLPEISAVPEGRTGEADSKVQAYNLRMILTNQPANRIPFSKPAHYDPLRYQLLVRWLAAKQKQSGEVPKLRDVTLIARIPGGKADFNNNGPISTDYIGHSWEYPNGSYAKRSQIWQDHIDYTKGFFYFLANDAQIPQPLREETRSWGLPKDEFSDTGHWPHQLYIREARRMVSDVVMTQKDLQTDLTKDNPIGMGSYNSDSHNLTRVADSNGNVTNEGDMQVPVKPYQIPYGIMVPKAAEASNVLVPVCFSASHVAYSSVRMEPQYMILGQAAGLAAAMTIRNNLSVQQVDRAQLSQALRKAGAVLDYTPSPPTPPSILDLFRKRTKDARFSPELF